MSSGSYADEARPHRWELRLIDPMTECLMSSRIQNVLVALALMVPGAAQEYLRLALGEGQGSLT